MTPKNLDLDEKLAPLLAEPRIPGGAGSMSQSPGFDECVMARIRPLIKAPLVCEISSGYDNAACAEIVL